MIQLGQLVAGDYFFRPACGCVYKVATAKHERSRPSHLAQFYSTHFQPVRIECVVPCEAYHPIAFGYEDRWSWELVDADPLRLAMALECR